MNSWTGSWSAATDPYGYSGDYYVNDSTYRSSATSAGVIRYRPVDDTGNGSSGVSGYKFGWGFILTAPETRPIERPIEKKANARKRAFNFDD